MYEYVPHRQVPEKSMCIAAIDLGMLNTAVRVERRKKDRRYEIYQGLVNFVDLTHEGTEKVKISGSTLVESVYKYITKIAHHLDECSYIFVEKQLNANTDMIKLEGIVIGILSTRYMKEGPNICAIASTLKTKYIDGCELTPEMKTILKGHLPKKGIKRQSVAYAMSIFPHWLKTRKVDDISDTIVYCDAGYDLIRNKYAKCSKTELVALATEYGLPTTGTKESLIARLNEHDINA